MPSKPHGNRAILRLSGFIGIIPANTDRRERRMKKKAVWAVLVFAGIIAGSGGVFAADISSVVRGNSAFSADLFSRIAASKPDENIFFSPHSISVALAMTYAGAGGRTAEQIASVMHFQGGNEELHGGFEALAAVLEQKKGDCRLEIANALWGQEDYPFLQDYIGLIDTYYGGGFRTVNFKEKKEEARRAINEWAAAKTSGKVRELLKPDILNELTRLVLTNAIYFRGNWAARFDPEQTTAAPFHVRPGETTEVQMMHATGMFRYAEQDGVEFLEMPYEGDELSMVVLLPGITASGDAVPIDLGKLDGWLAAAFPGQTEIWLPKFRFEAEYRLDEYLKEMGMADAFSLPPADFSGLNGRKDLYITAVVHKAVIDVNEEGSEAAAATAVVIGTKMAPRKNYFRADRPFIFLIRHNETGAILFLGRVVRP